MDFQAVLHKAGQALSEEETQALAFLCSDILGGRKHSMVQTPSDLFSLLTDKDKLSKEQPHLLADLLIAIGRPPLVRQLGLWDQISIGKSLVSPYRKLLYDLSDNITQVDLKDMKFLLRDHLPRKKMEKDVTTLNLFLEMEHKGLLSENDLNRLEHIIVKVCPMLMEMIQQFKATMDAVAGPSVQETGLAAGRLRSGSERIVNSQVVHPLVRRPASCELPPDVARALASGTPLPADLSRSLNPSTTSLDDLPSFDALRMTDQPNPRASSEKRPGVEAMSTVDAKVLSGGHHTTTKEEEGLGAYLFRGPKPGVCLIINNYNFEDSAIVLRNRTGTQVDEERLKQVFQWLGFEVELQRDLSSAEILSTLQQLGQRDHSRMDCVVCCVLSHGQEGGVYGVDGQLVRVPELTEPLDGSHCPSLLQKPKLFFIQACQGREEQQAVPIQGNGTGSQGLSTDAPEADTESIPVGADVLLAMATVHHYVSYRDKKLGTWFIQSLCQNLVRFVPRRMDLVSIMTKVNDDVSKKADPKGEKKQMPQPALTLRKRVVFPVPTSSPPSLL